MNSTTSPRGITTVDLGVVVNERKVLTLLLRESHFRLDIHISGHRVGQGACAPLPPSEPYVIVSHHTAQAFQRQPLLGRPAVHLLRSHGTISPCRERSQ
jgi:hypothetical protein